jgi:Sec-independent protein secretion pathway component TatC
LTQCGLAGPLIILYEISVISVKMVEPKVVDDV